MPTTAREDHGNLIIDLGGSGTFTIPPMPGKNGRQALKMLLDVAFGAARKESGPEGERETTERLTMMCLGCDRISGFWRKRQFERLRATHQELVGEAAILWNVHGGSIDAVNDLLDEAGGYPKALGRVLRSCGLGPAYEALTTLLDGAAQAQNSVTDSMPSTTIPTGTGTTSDS